MSVIDFNQFRQRRLAADAAASGTPTVVMDNLLVAGLIEACRATEGAASSDNEAFNITSMLSKLGLAVRSKQPEPTEFTWDCMLATDKQPCALLGWQREFNSVIYALTINENRYKHDNPHVTMLLDHWLGDALVEKFGQPIVAFLRQLAMSYLVLCGEAQIIVTETALSLIYSYIRADTETMEMASLTIPTAG